MGISLSPKLVKFWWYLNLNLQERTRSRRGNVIYRGAGYSSIAGILNLAAMLPMTKTVPLFQIRKIGSEW
jgi:hypothetical protein